MTQELKQAFQLKRDELIEQRETFNYVVEDRKIASLEAQFNEAVAQRNDKKSLYERYDKSINQLDSTLEYIEEIMGVDDVPLEPVKPETPVEEEI